MNFAKCGNGNQDNKKIRSECGIDLKDYSENAEINDNQESDKTIENLSLPFIPGHLDISDKDEFEKSSNLKKRFRIKPAYLIVIACEIVCALVLIFIHHEYLANIKQAEQFFISEKYSDAAQFYKAALSYREDPNLQTKCDLCMKLATSYDSYNMAVDYLNKKDYLGAYNSFKLVVPEDTKRYANAQTKIPECRKLFIDNQMENAKDSYANGDYRSAVINIGNVFLVDQNNAEAKQLQVVYNDALDKKNEADQKAAEAAAQKAREQQAAEEAQAAKDNMRNWEGYGVKIAVTRALKQHSVGYHYANGDGTFVLLDIAALNDSSSMAHVNPNDFTLSDSSGYTVPPNIETYGLSNYFNAVDLNPSQQTSGYIVFYLKNDSSYTLNYSGFNGSANKHVVF